ncbi:MAG: hypothetical protein HYV63_06070 [Candidatus Schekmanbacteria bacterium]|nr:hypothetical protein [Candidatus Schekmanbacteria bacterium]
MSRACLILLLTWTLVPPVWAADDPSIQGELRQQVRASMEQFVKDRTVNETFLLYDPIEDRLLRLELEKLHDGIVKKGELYVSCADFKDQSGRALDVDLFVLPAGNGMQTTQAVVHKVDGKKRQYQLEVH